MYCLFLGTIAGIIRRMESRRIVLLKFHSKLIIWLSRLSSPRTDMKRISRPMRFVTLAYMRYERAVDEGSRMCFGQRSYWIEQNTAGCFAIPAAVKAGLDSAARRMNKGFNWNYESVVNPPSACRHSRMLICYFAPFMKSEHWVVGLGLGIVMKMRFLEAKSWLFALPLN